MPLDELFSSGAEFMTLSERRLPDLERAAGGASRRMYKLDMSRMAYAQDLYQGLLQITGALDDAASHNLSWDGCRDLLRGCLGGRPEDSVLIAVIGCEVILNTRLELLLRLLELVAATSRDLLHAPKGICSRPVLLRLVLLGSGHNFPDELENPPPPSTGY